MKLTESQLRSVINEEITSMIEEGEIDEGIFDAIKGAAGKVGKDIGGAVKKGADAAVKYGKGVVRSGQLASLASDLEKKSDEVLKLVQRLGKLDPELRSKRMVLALMDMKKRAGQLRAQMEE